MRGRESLFFILGHTVPVLSVTQRIQACYYLSFSQRHLITVAGGTKPGSGGTLTE
jgi:hypothetical protein